MPDLSTLPPELRPLITHYQTQVRELMADLENGRLSPIRWREAMQRLLARYHGAALLTGLGSAGLGGAADTAVDILERAVKSQWDYLDNFYTAVAASSEFNPAWVSRALMYTLSAKASFYEGEIYRQAGRFLPLPAMPGDGTTQCLTNCGCRWYIEKITDVDFNAWWKRGLNDSCQTCLQREGDWSPLRIVNGRLL